MVSKVNYKKFLLISLGFSIIVFTAGLLLGISLDDKKVNDLVLNLNQNELNAESYNIEKDFIASFGGDKCSLSRPRVESLSEELGRIGSILTSYESSRVFESSDINYLKRKYFLLEIKSYNLFESLKEECNYNYTTILFFYDLNDVISLRQGSVLDALVNMKPNVNIFSFDRAFKEDPAFETFKLHYNITSSPTMIINNKIRMEGLVDFEGLLKIANEN